MLEKWTIKQLYALALAEGEGVGTAYEYYVKRLALVRWLAGRPRPQSIVLAGLPEKYGVSLDLFLLAHECRASLMVIDERSDHLEKARLALANIQKEGLLKNLTPTFHLIDTFSDLPWDPTVFDLAISSEVVQRLDQGERLAYAAGLRRIATATIVFAPNKDNESHVGISGLGGVTLTEINRLWPDAGETSYIDLPPFPPGITRTGEQREQATSGRLEAGAMWGLMVYANLEKVLPHAVRRRYAHIVYTMPPAG